MNRSTYSFNNEAHGNRNGVRLRRDFSRESAVVFENMLFLSFAIDFMFPRTSTFYCAHDTLNDTNNFNFIGYDSFKKKKNFERKRK